MTEQDLINMGQDFKSVVDRKDREIKYIKEINSEADDDLRNSKDWLIATFEILKQLKYLYGTATPPYILNKMTTDIENNLKEIMKAVSNCRDTIDLSDLDEDFFESFGDQI